MLMTGNEYLDSIRDGRRVYIGSEVVEDVTTHPAFRNAAHSFAMIYDRKRAAENRHVMTFEEDGDTFSTYFLLPKSLEDLQRRYETHRRIASWTYGLLGRGPDNFPSYVSGAGDGSGDVRAHPAGLRRQHPQLLPPHARKRPNCRYVYGALHWCTNNHADIADAIRELMGAGVFQMPADVSVLSDPTLNEKFETYWSTPGQCAKDRMKLSKLAWDLLGSDFAGRHMQYEKFYAGPAFVMNSYSYLAAPWRDWAWTVDQLMASYV